jgi:hypothetical protein
MGRVQIAAHGSVRMGKLGFVVTAGLGAAGGFLAAQRLAGGGHEEPAFELGGDATNRLMHIARIRQGSEGEVRRVLEERFPRSALDSTGIQEMTVFVGSGYLLTQYGFSGEFTPVFTAFRADPGVAAYLEAMGQLLDDQPAPMADEPGGQYVASQAAHWSPSGGLEFAPHLRSKEASSDAR